MAIVLRPHGKLNAKGAVKLKRKLDQLVTDLSTTPRTWVVDLWDVSSIDRNGIVTLLQLRRQAQQARCRLVLRDLSETVRATLEVAHLTAEFEIQQTPGSSKRPRRSWRLSREDSTLSADLEASDLPQMRRPVMSQPPTSQPPRSTWSRPSRAMALELEGHERQWTTWRH